MRRRQLMTSARQNWGTPRSFYKWVDAGFRFTVDTCAEPWNTKHSRFWSKDDDGLAQDWTREIGWCNPEYDKVEFWLQKGKHAAKLGGTSVHLVASRVDTDWWRSATEADNGRLRDSYFHQRSRVWWTVWSEITIGIYHHDQRIPFDLPIEEKAKRVALGKSTDDGAVFPSSILIFDPPRFRKRLGPPPPTRKQADAALERFGRPLLTEGRPR
jgi:hypothetical protein